MQSVSSRIWTRVAGSISYDDNDYPTYIDALKSNGYKENFTYKEEKMSNDNNKEINKENRHKNRKRKIIWFNPPIL